MNKYMPEDRRDRNHSRYTALHVARHVKGHEEIEKRMLAVQTA